MNNALLLIFIGAVFDTCGDLLMKNWVISTSKTYFISGMFFYLVGLAFLAYSFTMKNMVIASVLYLVFNILLLTVVNSLYFKELLNNKEMLALFLGVIAIILFEIK